MINAAVFLLALFYLATCISAILLLCKNSELVGRQIIPLAGAGFSILLLLLIDPRLWVIGLSLLAVGVPIYVYFSPRQELKEMREAFYSRENTMTSVRHESRRFLALPVHLARHLHYRLKVRRGRGGTYGRGRI